jgi:hypothetical protein
MILSTHAVVGAAIASFLPEHPAAAFALAFASHYALDAIPHWDYPIASASMDPKICGPMRFDRAFLRDVVTIGADGLLGAVAAFTLFASPQTGWVVLLGAFGAMLPDALQFLHARFPHEPLKTLQRLHRWAHSKREIKARVVAIASQVALAAGVTALSLAAHGTGFFTASLAAAPIGAP